MSHLTLSAVDWSIIIGYCLFSLGIGIFFSRRATQSISDYFIAGRTLPWWIAGTSIVATSFAADTPLAITAIVRTRGLQGNWYWWSGVMAFMLCVVVFAPMWRRANILTDAEFIELRYEGRPASILRTFHAVYRSTFQNCITMGWVILAMIKIIDVLVPLPGLVITRAFELHWIATGLSIADSGFSNILFAMDSKIFTISLCMLIAVSYSVISGFWGVVATDFVQFFLAMIGSIALAIIVLVHVGGPHALVQKTTAAIALHAGSTESKLVEASSLFSFAPDLSAGGLAIFSFFVFIAIQWWGGAEGGGFLVQRLFSCKDEKHSMLAVLWFSFAHFVIRTWPWLIVGIASIIYFPNLVDPELAYPHMVNQFLPIGLKGMMVAAMLAAFMSTIDTHLSWGSSYWVNDIYKRFIRTDASQKHYVMISQVSMILMMVLAGITAYYQTSIYSAWIYVSEMMIGTSFAVLARWFWWRVNPWTEISAMIASLALTNLFRLASFFPSLKYLSNDELYPVRLVIILVVSTAIWVTVTFLTKPTSNAHLINFYSRLLPPGRWNPIANQLKDRYKIPSLYSSAWAWLLGICSIYTSLFGVGWILFGQYYKGLITLVMSCMFGYGLIRAMDKLNWGKVTKV